MHSDYIVSRKSPLATSAVDNVKNFRLNHFEISAVMFLCWNALADVNKFYELMVALFAIFKQPVEYFVYKIKQNEQRMQHNFFQLIEHQFCSLSF